MRAFITALIAALLASGCASVRQQSAQTDTADDTGDNVMLLIQAAPLFVVITPFWLTEQGLRSVREMVETPIYVPAGKTKKEFEQEIASIPSRRSPRFVDYRDGD